MSQRLSFDLTESDIEEGGYKLIEEGTYDVEIVEAEMQNSKNKGTLGYKIQYKSTNGEFSGRLFEDVWITAGTLLKGVKTFIKATGRTPVPDKDDQSIPLAEDLIGAELSVTVEHETYNEVTRAKVKGFSWKAVGSGGAKKADDGSFSL